MPGAPPDRCSSRVGANPTATHCVAHCAPFRIANLGTLMSGHRHCESSSINQPEPRSHARLGLRKAALTLLLAAAAAASPAAQASPAAGEINTRPAEFRLGAERVELPGDEGMTLVGTTYRIGVAPGFSVGPAAYGAIGGRRGGLFTLGLEAGWQGQLAGPLGLDLGFYAGGGGGGSAPVGSGLMLRPHADLLWDFGGFRAGLSLAQVRFSGGQIDSTQVGLVLVSDGAFRFLPGRPTTGLLLQGDAGAQRSGVGFDRVQAVYGRLRPQAGSQRIAGGGALSEPIGLIGVRLLRGFGEHAYWGLEAAGAASGGVAGYAEYLASLGAERQLGHERLQLGARAALGMGGGGDIDVGGGLLWKAAAYARWRLTPQLGVLVETGWAGAPQGSLRARQSSVALDWWLDHRSASAGGQGATASSALARMEWTAGVERYRAARRDGGERSLEAVVLRVNRFLGPRLYLSGEAHSAYGGGAGGYSAGLLGLGAQWPLGEQWHLGLQASLGAAGGGGVDTQGGAIMQPMAFVGRQLSPGLALRLGAGAIRSWSGPLRSPVLEASLVFGFGVAGRAAP